MNMAFQRSKCYIMNIGIGQDAGFEEFPDDKFIRNMPAGSVSAMPIPNRAGSWANAAADKKQKNEILQYTKYSRLSASNQLWRRHSCLPGRDSSRPLLGRSDSEDLRRECVRTN